MANEEKKNPQENVDVTVQPGKSELKKADLVVKEATQSKVSLGTNGSVKTPRWVVRNRSKNVGYYYYGATGTAVQPGQHEVLTVKPTLVSADLTVVEVNS